MPLTSARLSFRRGFFGLLASPVRSFDRSLRAVSKFSLGLFLVRGMNGRWGWGASLPRTQGLNVELPKVSLGMGRGSGENHFAPLFRLFPLDL